MIFKHKETKTDSSESTTVKKSILVLAPQPFFQNRGTPIAVKLLVEELAALGYEVHLLVFHEGDDLEMPGVHIHRTPSIWGIHNIPPSISWKKIVCDVLMFFKGLSLLRTHNFKLVHAVEESVFLAMVYKLLFRIQYIYDMDSSLALQLVEKMPFLRPLNSVFQSFEKVAIKGSCGVVAVCGALEEIALAHAPEKYVVRLEDISFLDHASVVGDNLREKYKISGPLMLYVGNLEGYQGIDLLFEGFRLASDRGCRGNIVIIGGTETAIAEYRERASKLEIDQNVYFCGPRPIEKLGHYLAQADILLSPRDQGNNTPMKLYSYLDSGKAILATDLLTHTQVLSSEFACLVPPTPEGMAGGIARLLGDSRLTKRLGRKGRRVAQERFSLKSYRKKLKNFHLNIISTLKI
ncbi:glycosyltransferase family 4 protein [Desulforhopalus sp. 52FAK]